MIANDYTLWLVSYSCRLPMIADCQWYLICWIEPPSCSPLFPLCWVHAPFHADWLNRTLWWLHPHFGFGYVPVFVSAGHIAYIPVISSCLLLLSPTFIVLCLMRPLHVWISSMVALGSLMLSHFPSHVVPWDLCLPLPFLVAKKAREISHASFVRKSSEYLGLPEMGGWIETYGINDIP